MKKREREKEREREREDPTLVCCVTRCAPLCREKKFSLFFVFVSFFLTFFSLASSSSFRFVPIGKVHGSLARAGKVRGQTPKVEKQEKKKVPKGRAYKRLLYNRRFVNVVVGFGKKKGPNSN